MTMRDPALDLVRLQAQFLSDLEAVRIGNSNRIRALTEVLGIVAGPELRKALELDAMAEEMEHRVELDLKHALRQTRLHPWVAVTVGLGEKQAARLLGAIGDPCWRHDADTDEWLPRTVGQLWSYCGYAVDQDGRAPRRKRGEQARYNTEARTRAFLIAESCIKQRHSPYRAVYDHGRAKYADAVHQQPCERCGPKGKPAQPGSDLSDGHKHMRAMRLVAKEMLKDLWIAADSQAKPETQRAPAVAA